MLGGAGVTWPLTARAQQPAMPVIGLLDPRSPDAITDRLRGFREGLKQHGYVEGENVAIDYRFAENKSDRLPELAADLIHRHVALILTSGPPSAFAAKAATDTIPILILVGDDPVKLGLVTSLSRPGGNVTGINIFNAELAAKRLELLRTLVPGAARLAILLNQADASLAEPQLRDAQAASRSMGLQIQVFNVNTSREIDDAFAAIARERPDAVVSAVSPFMNSRRVQLAQLAAYYRIPTIFPSREYVEVGGLMSYGADVVDGYRQLGIYAGQILKGVKPADLPVVQANKFELAINTQTARMLGLTVPPSLLAIADDVIE